MRRTSSSTADTPLCYAALRRRGLPSELITEGTGDHPRPQRRLRGDELLRADESTGVRIAKVLGGQSEVPGILGDAHRGIVGRIGGILEPASRGTHRSPEAVVGICARLGEGMS